MHVRTAPDGRTSPPLRLVRSERRLAVVRHRQREQVVVDDVAFDALTEDQVVDHVLSALDRGEGGNVITPNVDILRQLREPELRELVRAAELIVPDGMPIVWASRLQGRTLPERVTGSSLIWSLSRGAARANRSLYLLGGAEGIAERAAERLQQEVPALRTPGWHCPPFGFERDPAHLRAAVRAVGDARPDVCFVGLGFPKQERLMAQLREHLPSTWFVGCGGALTMVAGEVSRAPEWVQRSGLEWAHRLAQEPRRMARRYLVDDMPYAVGLMVRSLLARSTAGRAS